MKMIAKVGKGMKRMRGGVMIAPQETSPRPVKLIVLAFGFIFLGTQVFCPSPAHAQGETTSAIVGQVTDATQAAIPGANVTIVNAETGLERRARTDNEGRFNFPQLS